MLGDLVEDLRGDLHAVPPRPLLEDHPADGAGSGGSSSTTRPEREALGEAVLEADELLGRAVGGQDELAAGVLEGVEGVEELLAGALLAREELDVVDEEHVASAEALLEVMGAPVAHGLDEVGR